MRKHYSVYLRHYQMEVTYCACLQLQAHDVALQTIPAAVSTEMLLDVHSSPTSTCTLVIKRPAFEYALAPSYAWPPTTCCCMGHEHVGADARCAVAGGQSGGGTSAAL
jgi:hypothetical protein